MRRSNQAAITALLLVLSGAAGAQSRLELTGFGITPGASDVVNQGMGGVLTIPGGPGEWLYSTPSTWHHIRATQLHVAFEAEQTRIGDLSPYVRVGPQDFQFLIHANRRISYGLGIQPVTRVNMALRDTTGVYTLSTDTLRYAQNRTITGGISAFRLGYSRRMGSNLSIGLALDVLFGSLAVSDTLEFRYRGSSQRDLLTWMIAGRRLEFVGQTVEMSLLASLPPKSRGQLGLQLKVPLSTALSDIQTQAGKPDFTPFRYTDVGIPASITVGYGMDVLPKQRVILEYSRSQLEPVGQNDLVFGQHVEATRAIRAGWSRTPSGEEMFALGRLYYRMGFSHRDYYLSALKNDPLAEFAVSVGIGLRTSRFGHRLDIALQAGRRDSQLSGVQYEHFYRAAIGVTTAELWFVRPKKKWD